ncbi:hypothetical protein [Saccharothrix deserti]|uniref:hypothetical protein n=1 Tax=Saccharothrix deserti TaxID=2593674 RepID=UPI00131BC762|nr:hypothetical protein [Saccharothrix deserti]
MSDIITELPRMVVHAAKAELYSTGAVPRPQVHLLSGNPDQPYFGYLVCRRFYRGADAAAAITELGALPSAMRSNRLVVFWEHNDLSTALELGGGPFPMALTLVEATLDQYILHWHPFDPVPTGRVVDGVPTLRLEWDEPARYENVPLPEPITGLLRRWRELRGGANSVALHLEEHGYEFNRVVRSR